MSKTTHIEVELLAYEAVNAPPFVWNGYAVLVRSCEHGVKVWDWYHIDTVEAKTWLDNARSPMFFNSIKDELWGLIEGVNDES